jgi:flagellar hook-associated protein 2
VSSSSVPGTNVPPVSFPGIASGIDYNAIITKLTSLTLSQNVSLNAQIATLNAANTELIKINNLLNCVQNSLGNLSDPALFNTWSATSSSTTEGTASAIAGATPVAGTYTITNQTLATATTITNNPAAGHSITDGGSDNLILTKSYAAVTPSNGNSPSGNGTLTIQGYQFTYNVNIDSVQSIITKLNADVKTVDPGFSASWNAATGEITLSSTDKPISLGAPSDSGNLLQVLKLDTAQINNTATSGTVTSTSNIGGINQAAAFNSSTSAGYVTPVTSGYFTINGVAISVSSSGDNTASVIARINSSNAGVIANYNAATNKITLTATATGPQNIVLGAAGDTSNFLTAAGLTAAAGATTVVGSQASVTVQAPSGVSNTVYSNSNQVTNAIPGVQLNLGSFSGPYTVSVASDNSKLVGALNTFVSAYNAAITEINNATIAPAVVTPQSGSSTSVSSASVGGGVLWNSEIQNVKDQLTSLVTGFFGNSTGSYNSLAAIGLQLTDSFTTLSTAANGAQNVNGSQPVQTQQLQGTDGTFQPLNVSKLTAALAANASQVQQLFQGSNSITNNLGNYLGLVTGLPTLLNTGVVGTLPVGGTAIIQGFENTNNDQISTLTDRIQQITDSANAQADQLRTEFTATEGQLAVYQSMQSQLAGFFKGNGG